MWLNADTRMLCFHCGEADNVYIRTALPLDRDIEAAANPSVSFVVASSFRLIS